MFWGGNRMENLSQEEKDVLIVENKVQEEVVKKHSVVGIISSVFVLITMIVSMILFVVFLSGVNDLKEFFDETYYTFEDFMVDPDYFVYDVDVTYDQEKNLIGGFSKMGASFIIFILTSIGYFIGLILGIVGMCQKNRKKLYSILGLSFSITAPILFVIMAVFSIILKLI